jgi:competence protein ComEC
MPLLWLSLSFLAGIILADNVVLPTSTWLIIAGAILGMVLALIAFERFNVSMLKRLQLPKILKPPLPISILLISICFGAARYQTALPDLNAPNFIAAYNDQDTQIILTGIITAIPDERDTYTNLRVAAKTIQPRFKNETAPLPVTGNLLIRIAPDQTPQYGDRINAIGYLETPPEHETFSYRDYLARQGIYSYMSRAKIELIVSKQGHWFLTPIFNLKNIALTRVYQLWPDPEASLFAGILLGVETGIPKRVQLAFKETGTTHIIAISGFNIAIVSGLFANWFGKILGPRKGALFAFIAIALYTILVGADAAVVRAALMGGLSLFARQMGRRQNGINTLAFVAAVMSVFNPHTPWDVGFQLSFAATLGLILYADPLAQWFIKLISHLLPLKNAEKLAGPIGEYFLFTIAAQITTLPIMAYHFGTISWSAFLVNPVILPVQPPIMIVGGVALILALIWLPLGKIAAPLAWPFVTFTIRAVEFFGDQLEGVLVLGELKLLWVILFYSGLLAATFRWSQIKDFLSDRKDRLQVALAVPVIAIMGIFSVIVWRAAWTTPDGHLQLTLLDVGTGDAILIETPEGRFILINGGPSASILSDNLGRRLPLFHRNLDWLIITNPQKDQIAALPRVIERFPPANVLWAGPDSASREADYLRAGLTNLQIPITTAVTGQMLDLGAGAKLTIIQSNERGAILLLNWDHFRVLLPLGVSNGDLESLQMGKAIGNVTALLLSENGHIATNPTEWIANLRPQLVLLSVAPDDRNGLPHREVIDALGGYSLLRTDQNGWIQISTDGQQMWVAVQR